MHAVVDFEPRTVLKDLRSARRRRRIAQLDPFEALYKVYLTGITVTLVVLFLSGATGDTKITGANLADLRLHAGAWVGLAVALAYAVGLRSGGRGGPLVVEAADVRHVLLAPVDRTVALRGPAIRQLRFQLLAGAATGGIGGLLALRRLSGAPLAWVATGAAVGLLAVAGGFGLALITSGWRLGRWLGGSLALVVLAWSAFDVIESRVTSPMSLLGRLALWPIEVHPIDLVGAVVALAALAVGLAVVGGTALEASERRASLVGQIRFAATLQDLRTVIVLRRQLAQELPRQRPWLRMPRAIPLKWLGLADPEASGVRRRNRHLPVWRRGWHGILRWPALRLGRVFVLGVAAGLCLVGVWNGTTPLFVVAGLALYLAALDVTEPLAQEVDHPDRALSFDVEGGELHLRLLSAPAAFMFLVCLVAVLTAAVATGGATTTWQLGAVVVLPAAMCALFAASMSVVKGPPPALSAQATFIPEVAGARAVGRLLVPPLVAVVGLLPVVAARNALRHHMPPLPAAAGLEELVVAVAVFGVGWVRYQEDARKWWADQIEQAKTGAGRGGASRS